MVLELLAVLLLLAVVLLPEVLLPVLLLPVVLLLAAAGQNVELQPRQLWAVEFLAQQAEQVTFWLHEATVATVAEVASMHPVQLPLVAAVQLPQITEVVQVNGSHEVNATAGADPGAVHCMTPAHLMFPVVRVAFVQLANPVVPAAV